MNHVNEPVAVARPKVLPLWLKVAFTAFMAVMIPYYWWAYGPANFLYFCDVAMIVTLVALWRESRFLTSLQGVGILLPQALWVADFAIRGVAGRSVLGLADYMYDPTLPLFVRGLSSFHGWLPFVLVFMLWRLGYDRRAFLAQVACGWALLLVCFFFTPAPPAPASDPHAAVNVNYVFGIGATPQTWMAPGLWVATLMGVLGACIYLPTHLVLKRVFRGRGERAGDAPESSTTGATADAAAAPRAIRSGNLAR
jgi:hypothetical protein